ncbi:MAG: alpha/beta hydrolase [Flavobacteriales bacterium]|nr:alpha/beta hydrolase [Flavobacteriales bacterium]
MVSYFTHGPTLAYRTYGHGPLPLLAFHGFGRTGEDFHILEGPLGGLCTIYAFDLHYHGNSPSEPIRAERPYTPQELADYFTAFMDHLGADKVLLLGYSFGGRTVLNLLEQVPLRVERAFLAAPDGLKTRPWYRGLATSRFGRWLYKRFITHPQRIHAVIHLLKAIRLMNERMHRFLIGQTDTIEKRRLVHDVWLSYRRIEPDLATVAANAERRGIPVHLFFGEFDRVIPGRLGQRLRKHAPETVSIQHLPLGHVLLTSELGMAIATLLGAGRS